MTGTRHLLRTLKTLGYELETITFDDASTIEKFFDRAINIIYPSGGKAQGFCEDVYYVGRVTDIYKPFTRPEVRLHDTVHENEIRLACAPFARKITVDRVYAESREAKAKRASQQK